MVRPQYRRPYKRILNSAHCRLWRKYVVDTPTDVCFSRATKLPPPTIVVRFIGVLSPKGIAPTRRFPTRQLSTFLYQETAGFAIRFRSRQIDFVVRCIVIADHKYRAALA